MVVENGHDSDFRNGVPAGAGEVGFVPLMCGLVDLPVRGAGRILRLVRPAMSTEVTSYPSLSVAIEGGFWKRFQLLVRDTVIPYQWKAMNDEIPGAPKSHSVENFRIAAGLAKGAYEGMVFQDSDLAKWLEAAGNVLAADPAGNPSLRGWVHEAVDLIARAQQPDGYVNTYFTVKDPHGRWKNLREAHELYCAGHLIEAGVSLYRGTADDRILQVVRRLADLLDSTFGTEPPRIRGYGGHEEVELALVKLARLTGEPKYLRLARYFIDERGQAPNYFEAEASRPGYSPIFGIKSLEYYQAHQPVREQKDAVGHAVRAMYLYTAMADLAMETRDAGLVAACDRLWESVTRRKMYVTGGIGSSAREESFGADYDLPNDTAYAETCAAIGLFLFSSRMARLHDQAKYVDVMERALFNGILSGLGLDGRSYFYVNPLEVVPAVCDANGSYRHVKYRRQPWYGCACCPPNIARTLSSLGDHACHLARDTLFVDLYLEGTIAFTVGGRELAIRETTRYPWDGRVRMELRGEAEGELTLALRVPGWCRRSTVSVNGTPSAGSAGPDGYLRLGRRWSAGDVVELDLPMPVERLCADPRVRAAYGRVALQRGPVVYCLEEADNGAGLARILLPADAPLEPAERPDLLGGVVAIRARGVRGGGAAGPEDGSLYSPAWNASRAAAAATDLLFIPYFAWANRTPGEMSVWVRE